MEGLSATSVSNLEIVNPYFSNPASDYIYKAKIDIYGRYFGGILIIKKVGDNSHRVVFTTEFGSKIFDFLYEGNTFTKNFMLEDLDKKIIVNTLQKDFKILVSEKVDVERQYRSQKHWVYKMKADNRFNFYFVEKTNNSLERIVNTSKTREKVEILFTSEVNNVAQKIFINHSNMNLTIDLNYFKTE